MVAPTSVIRLSRLAAKRTASWLILSVSFLAACWSERITSWDDLDPFLRFRMDGTLVEYRSLGELFGLHTHFIRSGRVALSIVGWDSTTGVHLNLSSVQALPGPGTYTADQRATDPTFRMGIYYRHPEGVGYVTRRPVPDDATILITHFGPTAIGGSFFGVLRAEGRPNLVITDGEFMVRRELDRSIGY